MNEEYVLIPDRWILLISHTNNIVAAADDDNQYSWCLWYGEDNMEKDRESIKEMFKMITMVDHYVEIIMIIIIMIQRNCD